MFSANSSQVSGEKLYVEDVFSTYLYTGTGAAQTITNNIDLAGKGGMVWIKSRSAATNNFLFDTSRGVNVEINSNTTDASATLANSLTAFNSNGFSISSATGIGVNAATYASWTFRKAPKFFDVVTYTGNGTTQSISHNLGVAPGVIIVKQTDTTRDWAVYHRSLGETYRLFLNGTNAATNTIPQNVWGNNTTAVAPTSTNFTVGDAGVVNASGGTYVAYLFAHDATSDGIIQCGSVTATTGQATVTLGWEPQWVLVKQSNTAGQNWIVNDVMRNMSVTSATDLQPSSSNTEQAPGQSIAPTATGFTLNASYFGSGTYIYIAIRRGPMKTPTLGTTVFSPVIWTGNATSPRTITGGGFPVDLSITYNRGTAGWDHLFVDRLRGAPKNTSTSYLLQANSTVQEITNQYGAVGALDIQDGVGLYTGSSTFDNTNASGSTYLGHFFRRAPSFFDEVCYTGTGVAGQTISHNLGVAPELIIIKKRNAASTLGWAVGANFAASTSSQLFLNTTDAASQTTYNGFITSKPTATAFNVSAYTDVGASAQTYVAYLFASCPGVSKCGSYTGNGSSQTINCGFAAGARFVLIKRTDSTGDWYVWDSARGIVAGNDPRLSLNGTAAEVTTDDSIDTDSSGFVVNQVAATNINVSSATYIYLAVA